MSDSSITSKCLQAQTVRFGHKIIIFDPPSIFDTPESNKEVHKKICKCIDITSPGLHAFILVLNHSRYTMEEQKTLEHYAKYFGEKFYNYLIILFTRKEDLDAEGVELADKLKTVSIELKAHITKCGGRVIAFNNRLKGEQQNEQVTELFTMILQNIQSNHGGCYTYEMYLEAEKQRKAEEIVIKAAMKLKKEAEEVEKILLLNLGTESKTAKEDKRDKETHRQCKSFLMKWTGEEKEEIHRRNVEDELKVKTEPTLLDLEREMTLTTFEKKRKRMLEESQLEYLKKQRNLRKEFEQANAAKSWFWWN